MVYTAASSGTVISAHYCMGDLASVTLGEKDNEGCEFCGMEGKGCCHDFPQVIKIDNSVLESQVNPGVDLNPIVSTLPVTVFCNDIYISKTITSKKVFYKYFNKPPPYLLHCNFRI